jgi:hypothetical protein
MVAALTYSLCSLTALLCTILLLAAYRRSRYRLLLWSGLCFAGLTLNNLFLVLDKVVFPNIDFSLWRSLAALFGMSILLYGLIWETE